MKFAFIVTFEEFLVLYCEQSFYKINVLSICLVLLAGVTEENSTVQIEPYISYGLIAWEQAANSSLNKILIFQKRALRLMYF